MNKVILIGNVTRDPETKTAKDTTITTFSLAIQGIKKEDVDFINCKCFGKTAELIGKYVTKGSKIAIEGRIKTGNYEKDGKKIYTTDIIVDKVEFLSKSNGAKEEANTDVTDELPF
jgi:single-strand DNA-binding protein